MKKYSTTIFLSLLFILAFANANLLPVQPGDGASSLNRSANSGFNTAVNYPESEIEYSTIQAVTGFHVHYGAQKTPVSPAAGNSRIPVIAAVLYSSTVFEVKELFDNNYLSYNYPSHNFW